MSASRDAILKARYLRTGESEDEFFKRVAKQWANDPGEYGAFLAMFREKRALPNTPALANAGLDKPMGSACFVLPVPDDTDGILDTLRAATVIHKHGGGTGFDFSDIRSKTEVVRSTGRRAPGPVEGPIKGYSEWLGRWSQAGLRRGANMGMLHIDHPDIMDFIEAKQPKDNTPEAKREAERTLTNFNISVRMTDAYLNDVAAGGADDPRWRAVVSGAWRNGEPGVFFDDTTNNARLHPERLFATNPCGEVPLRPYEACVLGSVDLSHHLIRRGSGLFLDEPSYRATIDTLTRLLDNIIELQYYPLPEIEREQKRYRKIGVGVMGFADVLVHLGIKYGTPLALHVAADWSRVLAEQSYATSEQLGSSRGPYAGYTEHLDDLAGFGKTLPRRRNLCTTVIAPTGTISRINECSFGIEPHFNVDVRGNFVSYVVDGVFEDHNPHYEDPCFTPASMVSLKQHIDTQAAWQSHVDQAVSKTVNCPNETTEEEVSDALLHAWKSGCKGVTILREGSRDDVVIGATTADCNGVACAV